MNPSNTVVPEPVADTLALVTRGPGRGGLWAWCTTGRYSRRPRPRSRFARRSRGLPLRERASERPTREDDTLARDRDQRAPCQPGARFAWAIQAPGEPGGAVERRPGAGTSLLPVMTPAKRGAGNLTSPGPSRGNPAPSRSGLARRKAFEAGNKLGNRPENRARLARDGPLRHSRHRLRATGSGGPRSELPRPRNPQ
jgi:hypothetical protein